MKALTTLLLALAMACPARAASKTGGIDPTSRFIFYAVLEGLYDDGVSTEDVNQILMKREEERYFHFIYACPICTASIWAFEAYRARPATLYSTKIPVSSFGPGLAEKVRTQLYSEDSNQRLIAINGLVRGWLERRIDLMHLSKKDRADLQEKLEQQRKDGMEMLKSFRSYEHGPDFGVARGAPAYVDLEECAVCNGAVGKLMKLPEKK